MLYMLNQIFRVHQFEKVEQFVLCEVIQANSRFLFFLVQFLISNRWLCIQGDLTVSNRMQEEMILCAEGN